MGHIEGIEHVLSTKVGVSTNDTPHPHRITNDTPTNAELTSLHELEETAVRNHSDSSFRVQQIT